MADFAKWATAAEPQDEKDTFIKEYRANHQSAVVSALEGSPVRDVLHEMINKDSPFEGTATELLDTLDARIGNRTPLPQSWPKSAKGLSSQLRRLAPALRSIGIEIEFPKRHGQAKVVRIFASQSSHASQSKEDQSNRRDANGDANSTRDAKMQGFSKTTHPQWNKPDFDFIPNSLNVFPGKTYIRLTTPLSMAQWEMRV